MLSNPNTTLPAVEDTHVTPGDLCVFVINTEDGRTIGKITEALEGVLTRTGSSASSLVTWGEDYVIYTLPAEYPAAVQRIGETVQRQVDRFKVAVIWASGPTHIHNAPEEVPA